MAGEMIMESCEKSVADAESMSRLEELLAPYALTRRELEIAACLLSVEPARNIAAALDISQPTVAFHSKNLYRKLGIQSRVEFLVRFGSPPPKQGEPP